MSLRFSQEKLFGIPLKSGAVSFGKINAQNANAFFLANNLALLSGSVSYVTVNISLESIRVANVPFQKPTLTNFGQQTFSFRGKTWTVLEVTFGGIYSVGSQQCYSNYNITAADFNTPEFSVG